MASRRHALLSPSRRRRAGISVVEFLVASSLILAVLVGSGLTLAAVERSLSRDRAQDRATSAASSILEQAALFRCQHVPEPADAASVSDVCWRRVTGSASSVDPAAAAGDLSFEFFSEGCPLTDPGCLPLEADLRSRWLRPSEEGLCPSGSSEPPALLERRLTLTWSTARDGEPVTSEYTSLQSVPLTADFQRPTLRSLAVVVQVGESARLTANDGSSLERRGAACSTPSGLEQTEIWFPFLAATGSYTVTVLDPAGATLRSVQVGQAELDGCVGVTVVRGSAVADCVGGSQ